MEPDITRDEYYANLRTMYTQYPGPIKRLAKAFPPGTVIEIAGVAHWICGLYWDFSYVDGIQNLNVTVSVQDPYTDYAAMQANHTNIPVEEIRSNRKQFRVIKPSRTQGRI